MGKRARIFVLYGVFIIVGAILPVAVMSYMSWNKTVSQQQERLTGYADILLGRARLSVTQAVDALRILSQHEVAPCSADHIDLIRNLTANSSSVDAIGFFDGNTLQCSSWGLVTKKIERSAVDYTIPEGIGVVRRAVDTIAGGEPMMVLRLGPYDALMNIKRLSELVVNSQAQLVVADIGGKILAQRYSPDPALVQQIMAAPASGMNDDYIYAIAKDDHLMAIAIFPRSVLSELWWDEQWVYLPIALCIDVLLIILIVRLWRRRLSPLAELQIGIKKREFIVHYQPIIDLQSGACIGAEALVRWVRPDGTIVRPDLFIPLAEENGVIVEITDQVIAAVVRDLTSLLVADRTLHIAINLSAADIKDGHIVPVLTRHLEHSGIHAAQIWLEMTERGFMDITSARVTLDQVRSLGHATALDDFGTGYSSLQYLQGLPMDALKIDKSFVDTIGTASASSAVITLIIDMAKKLQLLSVAEGVETQAQVDFLREHGVDLVQGWFYSKPLTCREFIDYYARMKAQFGSGTTALQTRRALKEEGVLAADAA